MNLGRRLTSVLTESLLIKVARNERAVTRALSIKKSFFCDTYLAFILAKGNYSRVYIRLKMGNVISVIQGSAKSSWWQPVGHRKAILNGSEETRNPVPPIANTRTSVERNIYSENKCDVTESEFQEKCSSRTITRTLSPEKLKELEDFRKQLAVKSDARKKLIANRTNQMEALRESLKRERRLREEAEAENTTLRALIAGNNIAVSETNFSERETEKQDNESSRAVADLESQLSLIKEQNKEMRKDLGESNYALQSANTEVSLLNKENFELKNQISALKEVKKVSKEMLLIRETQLAQLKEKLTEIEKSLADREMRTMSDELKREYERQLENIRNLRSLYEERARVAEVTRHGLLRDLDEQKILAEARLKKCEEFEVKIESLEKQISDKDDILGSKESQLGLSRAETRGLQSEMTVINQLFSQMLLGYNGNGNQDLDKLLVKLEENHDLLTDMVLREDCSEMASALPKLILDLVNQIDASEAVEGAGEGAGEGNEEDGKDSTYAEESGTPKSVTSAKEIVGNLPKVWRVLTELLSQQAGPLALPDIGDRSASSCYKSVETPSGPRMVPSVSKTYIRLKDLILEKKSLQKEMNRLKQLNSHLENRLQDQGRRLGLVSSELSKTWHVVGRMERQHQQLHTHEKILRYELQQKRKMLTELKEELEFCKEKWDRAKQKNSESQIEWDKLRIEFASRKLKSTESVNNSAESGYSDERASDEDSDGSKSGKLSERRRVKKKGKSPDINGLEKIDLPGGLGQEEAVDSDAMQDEEGTQNGSVDVPSDCDSQTNLADTQDQPASDNLTKTESEEEMTNSQDEVAVATSSSTQNSGTCYDDVLAARSARLKKLEEQCYVLVNKVTKTNHKGVQLCNRLEELHIQYGGSADEPSTSSQSDATQEVEQQHFKDNESITERLAENTGSHDETLIRESNNTEETEPLENIALSADEIPSTSESTDSSIPGKSSISEYESRFAVRDERLKQMEEQAKSLVNKISNTSTRSVAICSRLDELHNTYGRSEEEPTDTVTDSSAAPPSTSSDANEQLILSAPEVQTQISDINNSPKQRRDEPK